MTGTGIWRSQTFRVRHRSFGFGWFECFDSCYRRPSPPKALSSSSPSLLSFDSAIPISPTLASWLSMRSTTCPCGRVCCPALVLFFSGSRIFSSLSSQPGATLRFSASSRCLMSSSHSFSVFSASSCTCCRCACKALQDAMISSGRAAWPLEEVTYFGFSAPMVSPVDDGGSVEGSDL